LAGLDEEAQSAAVSFTVTQAGESRGTSLVQLRHSVERQCGGHALALTCALWVYNCAGLPLALAQSNWEQPARPDDEVSCSPLLLRHPSQSENPLASALRQYRERPLACSRNEPCMQSQACLRILSLMGHQYLGGGPLRSLIWRACRS
jgi:hypothetical protein